MLFIETEYPCRNSECGQWINPGVKHCLHCGTKQTHEGRTQYNLFSTHRGGKVYNMTYGGGMILDPEDIKDLVARREPSVHYDCFVGAYLPGTSPDDEMTMQILHWFPITDGQLGADLGPQEIKITNLES